MKILGIITGILIAIGGGYCVFNPTLTLESLTVVFAISLIESAVISIILWFKLRRALDSSRTILLLIIGILSAIAGIGILTNYFARFAVLGMMITMSSVAMLFAGIGLVVKSIQLKKIINIGYLWIILLIMGIITTISGVISIIHPDIMGLTIGVYIGIEIMTFGFGIITYSLAIEKEIN